ncbi:solute carrier family 22 member 13-like [Synchiropus splendidus]|uniref:solute carrier family 22 member 13-like n=1 Tax=Synchiropus splendidus TaxID=270530 RepID=UPI00237EC133|nr:solute carrier family 22 member 13-like [Synchiropus splendidus]
MSTFAEILKEIGVFGFFQKRMFAALCLPNLFVAFDIMSPVFTGLSFPNHCNTDWILKQAPNLTEERQKNLTIPVDRDGNYESCRMFTPVDWDLEWIEKYGLNTTTACINSFYFSIFTYVFHVCLCTQFNLVCDQSSLIEISVASPQWHLLLWHSCQSICDRKLCSLFLSADRFATSVVYSGLSVNVGGFGLSIYITQFIFGLVEIPACFGVLPLIDYLGRKYPLSGLLSFGGLACLGILAIPKDLPVVVTVVAVLGKFAAFSCSALIYIYTAELYPTNVRQSGVGLNSTFARVAGILAPLTKLLVIFHETIPMLIYGIVPITAAVLCLFLPETRNTQLQDHVEDL